MELEISPEEALQLVGIRPEDVHQVGPRTFLTDRAFTYSDDRALRNVAAGDTITVPSHVVLTAS